MTKRILVLLMAITMIVAFLAGCAAKEEADTGAEAPAEGAIALTGTDVYTEEIKLAFIPISTAGIMNEMYNTAIAEGLAMYPNVTLNVFDGQYDPTVQNSIIQDCITQGYHGIIMEGMDTEASNTAITDAETAGIPVITLNGGCATAPHTFHIQGADYEMGQQGAEYLAAACGNSGNAIILDAPAEAVANARMGTGAQEYFEQNTEMTIIDHQYIERWSTDDAVTKMSNLLTKYQDIQCVYCASDDIAIGAVQAIEAANRQDEGILVWGGTGYPSAFQAIRDGRMYGTSWCDSYSEMLTSIYACLAFIDGGVNAIDCGYTETPSVKQVMIAVTVDNIEQIYPISRWEYDSAFMD